LRARLFLQSLLPELINRGTYVGIYIVIGEVAREGTAEQ
jgi:hypothetical protein